MKLIVDVDFTIFRGNVLERFLVERYGFRFLDYLHWRIRPVFVLFLVLIVFPKKRELEGFILENRGSAPFWPPVNDTGLHLVFVSACFPLRFVLGSSLLGSQLFTLSCSDYLLLNKNKKKIFTRLIGNGLEVPLFVGDSMEDSLDGYPFKRV